MREAHLLGVLLAAAGAPPASASDLVIDGQTSVQAPVGATLQVDFTAGPSLPASVFLDVSPGPVVLLGESVPLGFTPLLSEMISGATDGTGALGFPLALPDSPVLIGSTFYLLGASLDPRGPERASTSPTAST